MATYTTAAIVRKAVEDVDTDLADADIEEYINQAEGLIDGIMEASLVSSFDADKHKILRMCATSLAAYRCIAYQPGNYASVSRAALAADMHLRLAEAILKALKNKRLVNYLEGL